VTPLFLIVSLLGQMPTEGEKDSAPLAHLRRAYRADAEKYEFHHDADRKHALKMLEKPIMRWANDDDWSGDVFIWTHDGLPEVVGCILSGPGTTDRLVFHEFHLLAEEPIAAVDLETRRRWEPKEGLARTLVPDAPTPATSATARLTQMRDLSRAFTAHMAADGDWELRLLPQPLFRYGAEKRRDRGRRDDEKQNVVDGALFAYVWTKGTDPEVILLLECRETGSGLAWHFAPVRFSNRPVWLRHQEKEVWRALSHREPGDKVTSLPYTTAFARTLPRTPPNEPKAGAADPDDKATR
jgi:hypothetical protein